MISDKEQEIISAYLDNISVTKIMKDYQLNSGKFYNLLKSQGISLRRGKYNNRRQDFLDKRDKKVIEDYKNSDNSIKGVLRLNKISATNLYIILKRHNIPQRQRPQVQGGRLKKDKRLYTKYRISLQTYNEILEAQKGKCAICGEEGTLSVNYDKKILKVRGLLCHGCRIGLGAFKDDSKVLQRAIDYLQRTRAN